MSETYITYGAIVELKEAVDHEEFNMRNDVDYDEVGLTYNGKFMYTYSFYKECCFFEFKLFDEAAIIKEKEYLIECAAKYGLEIVGEIKPYIQQYYSGGDSAINMIENI